MKTDTVHSVEPPASTVPVPPDREIPPDQCSLHTVLGGPFPGGQGMAYYQIGHELAARKDLSANDKLIFGVIKDHFRGNGRAYPGIRRLEREAGLSRKTVIAAIRKLESAGLLIVDRGKIGARTYYRFPESGGEPPPVGDQKAVENGQESGGELDKSGGVSAKSGGGSPPEPPIEPLTEPPHKPKRPKRRAKPRAEDEPVPENLKAQIFETAWTEWLTYRRENKKAVSRAAAKKQLAMLAEAGVDDAIAMLDNSIKNDWQGVFPLNKGGGYGEPEWKKARNVKPNHDKGF